jgi:hypothetical protein
MTIKQMNLKTYTAKSKTDKTMPNEKSPTKSAF